MCVKASSVIGEGLDSFPIVEEFEAKKRGIRCAVYCKLLITATEALIHRASNYPDLLAEMPRYCCLLEI